MLIKLLYTLPRRSPDHALGVGAAAIAVALRTPVIVAVVLAAVVTALARLFLG
jgi:hypothetical protein